MEIVLAFVITFGIYLAVGFAANVRAKKKFSIAGEGVFAEYTHFVKHTKPNRDCFLMIKFADGKSCFVFGLCSLPFKRGEKIRVWTNGLKENRIEKIEEQAPG